jgi:hypothetical protein
MVEFASELNYIRQVYNDKLEPWEANLIPITPEQTFTGINAALEEGGTITGKVTSAATKAPVQGAQACAGIFAQRSLCATTNALGEYAIPRLTSGDYTVYFDVPSGGPIEYIGQYYEEREFPETESVPVTVRGTTPGIDASLRARGGIAGKVTSAETKAPVGGVSVCDSGRAGTGEAESCATTNANGEYDIPSREAGTYALSFDAYSLNEQHGTNYLSQGYDAAVNPQANSVVVKMAEVSTVNDELHVGGRISGDVTNARTHRPAGGWPCVEDLSKPDPHLAQTCARSMSEGEYSISELEPGTYRASFARDRDPSEEFYAQYWKYVPLESEATPIVVEEGSAITGVDAALKERKAYNGEGLEGRVIDAATNGPIEGIEVCAYLAGRLDEELFGECTTTNAAGAYALLHLSASGYLVEFAAPAESGLSYLTEYFDEASSAAGATPVIIEQDTISTQINAALLAGGLINGRVTAAGTGYPANGIVVCAVGIEVEDEACAATNRNGEYTINDLSSGSYSIVFLAPPGSSPDYLTQYYNGQSSAASAEPVHVTAGQTTSGIDAAMAASEATPTHKETVTLTNSTTTHSATTSPATSSGHSLPLATLSRILLTARRASVNIRCGSKPCRGSAELTIPVEERTRVGRRTHLHVVSLVLAHRSVALAQESSGSVSLTLTAAGRQRLASATAHPIAAKLTLVLDNGTTITKSVRVR